MDRPTFAVIVVVTGLFILGWSTLSSRRDAAIGQLGQRCSPDGTCKYANLICARESVMNWSFVCIPKREIVQRDD